MGIGMPRARNWGKDAQQSALAILLESKKVAHKVANVGTGPRKHEMLFLAGSHGGLTLPFTDGVADLVHACRGRWEARHPFDGRLLAYGVSKRDVIRATIKAVWH